MKMVKETKIKDKMSLIKLLGNYIWIVFLSATGIFLILGGLTTLFINLTLGIIFLTSGLVLFPPFIKILDKKLNVRLNGLIRFGLFFSIFFFGFIIMALLDSYTGNNLVDEKLEEKNVSKENLNTSQTINKYLELNTFNSLSESINNKQVLNKYISPKYIKLNTELIMTQQSINQIVNDTIEDCIYLNKINSSYCSEDNSIYLTLLNLNSISYRFNDFEIHSKIEKDGIVIFNVSYKEDIESNLTNQQLIILENQSGKWKISEIKFIGSNYINYEDYLTKRIDSWNKIKEIIQNSSNTILSISEKYKQLELAIEKNKKILNERYSGDNDAFTPEPLTMQSKEKFNISINKISKQIPGVDTRKRWEYKIFENESNISEELKLKIKDNVDLLDEVKTWPYSDYHLNYSKLEQYSDIIKEQVWIHYTIKSNTDYEFMDEAERAYIYIPAEKRVFADWDGMEGSIGKTKSIWATAMFSENILKYDDIKLIIIPYQDSNDECLNWWYRDGNRSYEEAMEKSYVIEHDLNYIKNCNSEALTIFNLSDILLAYNIFN